MTVVLEVRPTLTEFLPGGRDRLEGTTARVDHGLFSLEFTISEIDGPETALPREGSQLLQQVTTPLGHPAESQFPSERWYTPDGGQSP